MRWICRPKTAAIYFHLPPIKGKDRMMHQISLMTKLSSVSIHLVPPKDDSYDLRGTTYNAHNRFVALKLKIFVSIMHFALYGCGLIYFASLRFLFWRFFNLLL
jgi:hypothetical protein